MLSKLATYTTAKKVPKRSLISMLFPPLNHQVYCGSGLEKRRRRRAAVECVEFTKEGGIGA